MLKIWGRRSSGNVQKVLWLAAEIGIEHEHFAVGGPYGGLNDPKFRLLNPHRLVPVIEDDGVVVWESNAILRYLAARHGGPNFWPSDPGARAQFDQWMDWTTTTYQPNIIGLFWAYWRRPEAERNWDQIHALEKRTAENLRLLDGILATRPYLAADHFTLADIPASVHLYRYYTMGTQVENVPHVRAWYERMQQRPAYREHVMVSYEELRARMTF